MRAPALVAWAVASALALASGCAGGEIVRRNQALYRAIGARDRAALEELLAPDFRFATPGAPKGDRRAFLEGLAATPGTVVEIDNDQLRLERRGERARLCGRQRAVVILDGKRLSDEARFCDRWERRNRRWVVTFAGPDDGGAAQAGLLTAGR